MRFRFLAAACLAAVLATTLSCGSKGSQKEILIGEYGSLTGGIATFGISTKNGSELAFEDINKKGGILGQKIKLLVEDDQSKPEEAGTVVNKLIHQDHVVAMLGHVASSHSLAAAPICQAEKIPMISPSSTNPRVTQVGNYIFRVCFLDTFQGAVMAKFAYDTLKVKKVAILVDVRSDYSVGLQTFFGQAFKKLGGTIVTEQSYSQGDSDFRAQLTAIKGSNPEAIYVPGYYTEVGTIVHQARELGITVPFLGSDGWDSPKLWEIGGTALNGCYFSNHYATDDPEPGRPEVRQRLQGQVRPDARRARRPRLRRRPHHGRRDDARRLDRRRQGARQDRRDQGFPRRDWQHHDQRGPQRREDGCDRQGREREVPPDRDHQARCGAAVGAGR